MFYHRIPHSSLEVSVLGLGTMTFGEQNSEAQAHDQLDLALANGVNLIDTTEMYPVPPHPETQGLTERYIGSWLKRRGQREKIVLASKVLGPARGNDVEVADSDVSDHLFRRHPISYSYIFRSPIPVIFDHVFAHLLTQF